MFMCMYLCVCVCVCTYTFENFPKIPGYLKGDTLEGHIYVPTSRVGILESRDSVNLLSNSEPDEKKPKKSYKQDALGTQKEGNMFLAPIRNQTQS